MIRSGLIAALALAAPGVLAQDVTGQYAAAQNMFVWPGVDDSTDAESWFNAVTPLIESLEGDWVAVDVLAMGSGQYDASQLADHCAPVHFAIAATSDFSFAMTNVPRNPDTVRLTVDYAYTGFNQFFRSRDTSEFLERMGFGADGPEPPMSLFIGGAGQGSVSLFHPTADILILQAQHGRPEIYARCPDK